jgi:transposase InsO family protein
MIRLGIHDGDLDKLLEHFPVDLRQSLRRRLQEQDSESSAGAVAIKGQQAIEPYLGLLGSRFIDDENNRPYRVVNIMWDESAKCVVAQRTADDELPPDAADGDTFVVDCGTDNCVLALVEKYKQRNPDEVNMQWLDEKAFALLQMQDTDLKKIIDNTILRGTVLPDGFLEWRPKDGEEELYRWHPSNDRSLRIVLQRVHTHGDISMLQRVCCIVVPGLAVTALLDRYHERYGHPGHDRMYRTIVLHYHWPQMQRDIHVHAGSCIHCQMRKHLHSKKTPLLSFPKNTEPFERCHMDLCGPFVTTTRGMQYILVFKDALTKWVELFALPNKTELAVAECLFDEILMRHGAPRVLISDQGTEFVNKVIDQIAIMLKIRRVTTSPYHPRADGLAENQVATLKDMLSAYVSVFQNDWDDYLAIVAHYYRTTVSTATGFTPYLLMYGRECRKPDELWIQAMGRLSDEEGIFVTDYVRGLSESMSLIWEMIGNELENKINKRNDRANRSLKQISVFNVGDRVWLEQPPVTTFVSQDDHEKFKVKKAFRPRFSGPYEVVKKISPITYVLNIGGQFKHHTIDRMKAFKNRPRHVVKKKELDKTPNEDLSEEKEVEQDDLSVKSEKPDMTDGLLFPVRSRKGSRRLPDDEVISSFESIGSEHYNMRSRNRSASVKSIMKRVRMIWLRDLVSGIKIKTNWIRHVDSIISEEDSMLYSYIQSYLS